MTMKYCYYYKFDRNFTQSPSGGRKNRFNCTKKYFFIPTKRIRITVILKNNLNLANNPVNEKKNESLFNRQNWEQWVDNMKEERKKTEDWEQSFAGQIVAFNYRIIMNFATNLANLIIILIILFILLFYQFKQFFKNWKDCLKQVGLFVVKLICTGLWLVLVYIIVETMLVPNINFVFIHLLVDPITSFMTTVIKNKITLYFTIEKLIPYLLLGSIIAMGSRPGFIQANVKSPNSNNQ